MKIRELLRKIDNAIGEIHVDYVQRAYSDQLPKAESRDSFAFHQPLGITWGVPIQFEGPEAHMHIAHDGTPKLYTAR